ncbi:MAG: undecaprenyl-diphosphatase UppP [Candidatus Coatesbacteria bacterium]|nr:undecaprenyl-diphosphatase UppP [Candidatus Coatesbacteria bacterium]
MGIILILLLGLIQGLTEFLPISSSGHLVVLQSFFPEIRIPLSYDVLVHIGTLVAVLIYFRRDILKLFNFVKFNTEEGRKSLRLIFMLFIATIPAAIAGLLFEDIIEEIFENPRLVAVAWFVMGLILMATKLMKKSENEKGENEISYLDAIIIGIAQAIAILPGVSRSGSTIIAGLLRGLKPEASAKFSFLMSIPVILGAGILTLRKASFGQNTSYFLSGALISAIVGYISIILLLKILEKRRFFYFGIYLIIISISTFIFFTYGTKLLVPKPAVTNIDKNLSFKTLIKKGIITEKEAENIDAENSSVAMPKEEFYKKFSLWHMKLMEWTKNRNIVILTAPQRIRDERDDPFHPAHYMLKRSFWDLVYFDDYYFVYMNKNKKSDFAYRLLVPESSSLINEDVNDISIQKVKKEVERALSDAPDHIRVKEYAALVYGKVGLLEEAIPLLEDLTRAYSGETRFLFNLGITYIRIGKPQKAEQPLYKALKIHNRPQYVSALANCYILQGKTGEAEDLLKYWLKKGIIDSNGYYLYANIMFQREEYEKADKLNKEALRTDKDNLKAQQLQEKIQKRIGK